MTSPTIVNGPALNGYESIVLQIEGEIATIKLNRPKTLNAFGGNLIGELAHAIQFLGKRDDVTFIVMYGEGRFFSSGADIVNSRFGAEKESENPIERKHQHTNIYAYYADLLRKLINCPKVLIMALNGPAVGGGAAWFLGVADIVLAADNAYASVPFSALGLVPEQGSGIMFPESMGLRRATEFLMFGRKLDVQEMYDCGLVNRIFPVSTFHANVRSYLLQQLATNSSSSMLLTKELMVGPLRAKRIAAVTESMDQLAERFVEGIPQGRVKKRGEELAAASKKAKI